MKIFKLLIKLMNKIIGSENEVASRINHIYTDNKTVYTKTIYNENKRIFYMIIVISVLILIIDIKENWQSNQIAVEKDGVYIIQRDKENYRNLDFRVYQRKGNETVLEREVPVKVSPIETKKYHNNFLEDQKIDRQRYSIEEALRDLDRQKNDTVVLPTQLKDGRKIFWEKKKSSIWILAILVFIIGMIYLKMNKFSKINKLEKNIREEIKMELPSFLNKIVLLLGAGLIFNKALDITVNGSNKVRNNNYFYIQLSNIIERAEYKGCDIVDELYEFAKETRVREFIRIVNIIWDNSSKGDRLAEKLQIEGELLWFSQKKDMEEKGRLSEGRLIMPLIVMLLILVVITVSPAMIDI